MADNLRAKLKKNTVAAPVTRTADTFLPRIGTSPSETRNKNRTTFYLPDHIRRGLKLTAADQDTTANDLVLTAIDEYVDRHPEIAHWFQPADDSAAAAGGTSQANT